MTLTGSPVVPAREALEIGEKYVASKRLRLDSGSLCKLEFAENERLADGKNDRILPCWVLTYKVKDQARNDGELYIRIFRDLSVEHTWGFWRLSASCDKEHYLPGESLLLKVTLTNTAPEECRLMVGSLLYDYSVTVLRVGDGATMPISRTALTRAIDSGSKGRLIAVGQSLDVLTDLSKALEQGQSLEPGRYIVWVKRSPKEEFGVQIDGRVFGEAVTEFTVGAK